MDGRHEARAWTYGYSRLILPYTSSINHMQMLTLCLAKSDAMLLELVDLG